MDTRTECLKLWHDFKIGKITAKELEHGLKKLGLDDDVPKEINDFLKEHGGTVVERGYKND